MLYHGSEAGAFSLRDSVLETLQCMRRAGKHDTDESLNPAIHIMQV